jgi:hypothetical protein
MKIKQEYYENFSIETLESILKDLDKVELPKQKCFSVEEYQGGVYKVTNGHWTFYFGTKAFKDFLKNF